MQSEKKILARQVAWVAVIIASAAARGLAEDDGVTRHDRSVFLINGPLDAAGSPYGSGFFVKHGSLIFLVTSNHMARHFNSSTRAAFKSSKPDLASAGRGWISLNELCEWPNEGTGWITHPEADVAVLRIDESKVGPDLWKGLNARCVDSRNLLPPPGVGEFVEVAGFPQRLGVQEGSDPHAIVFVTYIAAIEMSFPEKWRLPPSMLLGPAGGEGVSGAPVFLRDQHATSARCIGVFYGGLGDSRNQPLSIAVPVERLKELLQTSVEAVEKR